MQGSLSTLLSQQRSAIRDSHSQICHYRSRLVDTAYTISNKRSENILNTNHPTNVITENMHGDGHTITPPLYPQHDRQSVRDKVKQLLQHPEVLNSTSHVHNNSNKTKKKRGGDGGEVGLWSGADKRYDLFHYGYNPHLLTKGQPRHHRHTSDNSKQRNRANDKHITNSPHRHVGKRAEYRAQAQQQKQSHLSLTYSTGSIYNSPSTVWEDTTYQHTLLLNLHTKLLLKMTFTALRHHSSAIIRAREAAGKYSLSPLLLLSFFSLFFTILSL